MKLTSVACLWTITIFLQNESVNGGRRRREPSEFYRIYECPCPCNCPASSTNVPPPTRHTTSTEPTEMSSRHRTLPTDPTDLTTENTEETTTENTEEPTTENTEEPTTEGDYCLNYFQRCVQGEIPCCNGDCIVFLNARSGICLPPLGG